VRVNCVPAVNGDQPQNDVAKHRSDATLALLSYAMLIVASLDQYIVVVAMPDIGHRSDFVTDVSGAQRDGPHPEVLPPRRSVPTEPRRITGYGRWRCTQERRGLAPLIGPQETGTADNEKTQ
jgi:hypothetical protein